MGLALAHLGDGRPKILEVATGAAGGETAVERVVRWIGGSKTALAALEFLGDLGRELGAPIPLAWNLEAPHTVSAIEVYPAGTLTALGMVASRYKRTDQLDVRRSMLRELEHYANLPSDRGPLERQADLLDAILCVLAGADFLRGRAMPPADRELAEREGWIWVRRPDGVTLGRRASSPSS